MSLNKIIKELVDIIDDQGEHKAVDYLANLVKKHIISPSTCKKLLKEVVEDWHRTLDYF